MLYERLSKIDDLTRLDHTFLEAEDDCYYLGEYTARMGFAFSETNHLIINLKKPMDRRGRQEWKYKIQAIGTVATSLRGILGQEGLEQSTFVPIPPSMAKGDPHYDDRLLKILARIAVGWDADVRELVLQVETIPASHASEERASTSELIENYRVDEALAQPPRNNTFIIFDDVLTTGRHFKAMQAVLSERFPEAQISGLFVARRVPNTDDF